MYNYQSGSPSTCAFDDYRLSQAYAFFFRVKSTNICQFIGVCAAHERLKSMKVFVIIKRYATNLTHFVKIPVEEVKRNLIRS